MDDYELKGENGTRNVAFEPDSNVTVHVKTNGTTNGDVHNNNNGTIDKPAEEAREGWGNKMEFILAIVGYAVGLGNVWRFPYLAHKNGGGAFLIPYILSLVFMGIPMFFLELCVGQRIRKGPVHVWNRFAPYLSGVGIASAVVSFLLCVYYNMIVGWCFYYLFISFQKNIPYATCPKVGNVTVLECAKSSPTTYYWYREVLNASSSIDDSGTFNWKLCLCLTLAWVIVYFTSWKGTSSVGKVVYFTALFPYLVLTIFFVRMCMLEGAGRGIIHMFTPQFDKLAKPETWLEAATQIFYSMGLGFGSLISMASYNDVHNNVMRDAILVSCLNCGTSIFAGIVIFGILGYKATVNYNHCLTNPALFGTGGKCDITKLMNEVAEGPGLTFIAFTEAISTMALPQLWSVLFFVMVLTLGIGSMIGTIEGVRTPLVDLELCPIRKEFTHLILCAVSLAMGMVFCLGSGEYWLQMFNTYSAGVGLLVIALLEVLIVVHIYGMKNFEDDIFYMIKKRPNWYWKSMWYFISPALMIVILVASLYSLFTSKIKYEAWNRDLAKVMKTPYQTWGVVLCYVLIFCSIITIPITALLTHFRLFKVPGGLEPGQTSNATSNLPEVKSTVALTNFEEEAA